MAELNPPSDMSLHPIWNHAVFCAVFENLPVIDENVQPRYVKLRELGHISPPSALPYAIPAVPGLVIRAATEADIAPVVAEIVAAGNYSEADAISLVTENITGPFIWNFIWAYKGRTLQFESVRLGLNNKAYLGLTTHFTRERPMWFWRECQEPVWRWLREAGYLSVRSAVLRKRDKWLPKLLTAYNAKATFQNENVTMLDLDPSASIFKGWPARRTAGAGWGWVNGDYEIYETEPHAELIEYLRARWATNPEKSALVLSILDSWYNLDHATLLVGLYKGELANVRLVRTRKDPDVASANLLSPIDTLLDSYEEGMQLWFKTTGYKSVTYFVPTAEMKHPKMQRRLKRINAKVIGEYNEFKQPFTEIEIKIL